jgi:hypothetical protein
VFYAPDLDSTAVAALSTFFGAIKNLLPNGTSWQVPGSGDLIDETNGELKGTWTQSGAATQASTATVAAYASGVGACIQWQTSGIVHKRRVKGKTFIVPLLAAGYDNNGTILGTTVTALQNAANTLVSTSNLQIWSRPFKGTPTNPQRNGAGYEVTAGLVLDRVARLRSRQY